MKINFEYHTEYGKFADALYFSDDEPLPSEEEIEAMKLNRLNNWIAIVNIPVINESDPDVLPLPPPPPPPPSGIPEELYLEMYDEYVQKLKE